MSDDLRIRELFLDIGELTANYVWDMPLPTLPAYAGGDWNNLHRLLEISKMIKASEFDQAAEAIFQLRKAGIELLCLKLAAFWLEYETDGTDRNAAKAYVTIDSLIDLVDGILDSINETDIKDVDLISLTDTELAALFGRILRLYIFSDLDEIRPAGIIIASADLEYLKNWNCPEAVTDWLGFMVEYNQARIFADFKLLEDLGNKWMKLCERWSFFGSGREYLDETLAVLELSDRHEQAMSIVRACLIRQPRSFDYLVIYARLLKRQGEFTEALQISKQLIKEFPEHHAGYCLLANARYLSGDYEQSLADANQACQLFPGNADSHLARAFIYLQSGRYEKALEDFRIVSLTGSYRFESLRGQGKCLSMLGKDLEALAHFQILRREYPDDPDVYYEIADIYFAAGYLDDCERVCKKCLQIDPSYVSAYVIMGLLALRKNQDEEALDLLTRAVEMEPDNPFALNELSYLKHLEGDDESAFDLVSRAIEESPDYADALCTKGTILYYRSDFSAAAGYFEKAIRLMPDHVSALVGKGNTLVQMFDYDEARDCFITAISLDPENIEAFYGMAMLGKMTGQEEEARVWQQKAVMLENSLGLSSSDEGFIDEFEDDFSTEDEFDDDFSDFDDIFDDDFSDNPDGLGDKDF